MPIYEYECQSCHKVFEYMQRMSEDRKTECEECKGALERIISQSAFHLKGGGWYKDLYSSVKKDGDGASSGSASSGSASSGGASSGGASSGSASSGGASSDSASSDSASSDSASSSSPAASSPAASSAPAASSTPASAPAKAKSSSSSD